MERCKEITFTGKKQKEAMKALEEIEQFVLNKGTNRYGFMYASIEDGDGVDRRVSFGKNYDDIHDSEGFEEYFDKVKNMIETCEDLKYFYISGVRKKDI